MKWKQDTHVRTLTRRGEGQCVIVPRELMERLGWNISDPLAITVIGASLVVTKVELPKIGDLLQAQREMHEQTKPE